MPTQLPFSPAEPTIRSDSAVTHPSALLICGVLAGPLYVVVSLAQALTRPGFDLTRHAWSLLANGPGGWVQVANLVVSGALVIAAASGLARSTGLRAAPVLLTLFGAGMIGAGCFRADPMAGFPIGTPDGPPVAPSPSGLLHLVTGGLGFLSLIAATIVLAVGFARAGRRGWATFSVITGVVFFAAFAGIASGSTAAPVVLGFVIAIVLAWTWLAVLCATNLRPRSSTVEI